MTRRNRGLAFRPVDTLPTVVGDVPVSVFLRPTKTHLTWNGERWIGIAGEVFLLPAGAGLQVRHAAIVVAGQVVPCDANTHLSVDGVVEAIEAGNAIVRQSDMVDGFAGLTDGTRYFVGAAGAIVDASGVLGMTRRLPVGWARSATELMVQVGEPAKL